MKSFNKNAAPILHLAGIEVNVVKVCYYIVLFSQSMIIWLIDFKRVTIKPLSGFKTHVKTLVYNS